MFPRVFIYSKDLRTTRKTRTKKTKSTSLMTRRDLASIWWQRKLWSIVRVWLKVWAMKAEEAVTPRRCQRGEEKHVTQWGQRLIKPKNQAGGKHERVTGLCRSGECIWTSKLQTSERVQQLYWLERTSDHSEENHLKSRTALKPCNWCSQTREWSHIRTSMLRLIFDYTRSSISGHLLCGDTCRDTANVIEIPRRSRTF